MSNAVSLGITLGQSKKVFGRSHELDVGFYIGKGCGLITEGPFWKRMTLKLVAIASGFHGCEVVQLVSPP